MSQQGETELTNEEKLRLSLIMLEHSGRELITKATELREMLADEIRFLDWQLDSKGWPPYTILLPDFLAKKLWRITQGNRQRSQPER